MNGIKIRGTGRCVPEHIVTNDDMAKIVETNDEWITTRTGIQHRHHCTTETVSYTHLDVYKRQPPMSALSRCHRGFWPYRSCG